MKFAKRRITTVLSALAVTMSLTLSVSAETILPDLATSELTTGSGNSAIYSYESETDTYKLVDEAGNVIYSEESSDSDSSDADDSKTTTTVKSDSSGTTGSVVTTAPVGDSSSSATTTTVSGRYLARYREEARREAAAMTTVKPAVTQVRTTVKVTTTTKATTTTTKSVYKGIDVSRHQGTIDWNKVKAAGIEFVMIRAGYGMYSDQVDANFKTNIAGAQKAGLDCGVYWYSYAVSTAEALKEAQVCYNAIKGYKLSYPVAFDIEDDSQMGLTKTQISNITKVFCDYLESKKYYVCVYSFASLLNNMMNESIFSNYDIWVAHIGVSKPNFNRSYGMWQYSHTGRVNGISGDVDLNYSYKYYPGIMKKQKLNGYT